MTILGNNGVDPIGDFLRNNITLDSKDDAFSSQIGGNGITNNNDHNLSTIQRSNMELQKIN